MPQPDSKTVTFRVSGAALERLTIQADGLGISRSQRARQILLEALGDEFERELLDGQRELRAEMAGLREDVARTLFSLLDTLQTDPRTGARKYPPEQLRAEVRRYLGRT